VNVEPVGDRRISGIAARASSACGEGRRTRLFARGCGASTVASGAGTPDLTTGMTAPTVGVAVASAAVMPVAKSGVDDLRVVGITGS